MFWLNHMSIRRLSKTQKATSQQHITAIDDWIVTTALHLFPKSSASDDSVVASSLSIG
jgi:hypothetical protein